MKLKISCRVLEVDAYLYTEYPLCQPCQPRWQLGWGWKPPFMFQVRNFSISPVLELSLSLERYVPMFSIPPSPYGIDSHNSCNHCIADVSDRGHSTWPRDQAFSQPGHYLTFRRGWRCRECWILHTNSQVGRNWTKLRELSDDIVRALNDLEQFYRGRKGDLEGSAELQAALLDLRSWVT